MDIGLVLPTSEQGTVDVLVDRVLAAAGAGLDSVWLTHSTGYDALTAIAIAAREVADIRLGTAVTPVQTVHPARLAAQARIVQAAAGGRLVLGVGVSHRVAIEKRYGLPYESPAAVMGDALAILRPLIDGEKAVYDGHHLSAHLRLTDEGLGGVPILVAALQPKMLRLAGGMADGTVTWCCGVHTIRERIAPMVTAAASEQGRPAPEVVVALPIAVTSDEAAGRAAADEQLRGYGDLPVYRAVLDEAGADTPGDIAIVGDEGSVRSQLRDLEEAGCTTFAAIRCGDDRMRARTFGLLADVASEP